MEHGHPGRFYHGGPIFPKTEGADPRRGPKVTFCQVDPEFHATPLIVSRLLPLNPSLR